MSNCIQIDGKSASLYINEEVNFGESVDTGAFKVPFNSLSLPETQNSVKSDEIFAGKEPSKPGKGYIELGGSVEMYIRAEAIYPWFKAYYGEVKTVAEGGLFKHIFTNTDGCSDSIQLDAQLKGGGVDYKNKGVKINSFGFNLVEEGDIKANFDLIGSRQKLCRLIPDEQGSAILTDANINSKTLELTPGTGFDSLEIGNVIVIPFIGGVVATDATDSKTIELTAGHSISKYDYIDLNGVEYDVISVSGNIIGLNETVSVLSNDDVEVLNNQYKIASINTVDTSIEIETGLKRDVVAADIVIINNFSGETLSGSLFNNVNATMISGDTRLKVGVESFSFSSSTGKEGKRDLNSGGAYSSIADGDIELKVEMGIVFTHDKAELLNDAKNGKETSIEIKMLGENGESLTINLPQGELSGDTPNITPGGMTASLIFTAFATDISKMITVELINNRAAY